MEEPYELSLMNLKELDGAVSKDAFGKLSLRVRNPVYKEIVIPKVKEMDRLKILAKLELFNFKLRKNMIRYCKVCYHNLIVDSRKTIDTCPECETRIKI
jgi:hypothetical protein